MHVHREVPVLSSRSRLEWEELWKWKNLLISLLMISVNVLSLENKVEVIKIVEAFMKYECMAIAKRKVRKNTSVA